MTTEITVKSLKEDAKALGIKGYSRMTKAKLLLAVEHALAMNDYNTSKISADQFNQAYQEAASDSEQPTSTVDLLSGDLEDIPMPETASASTQETKAVSNRHEDGRSSRTPVIMDDDFFDETTTVQVSEPLVKYVRSDNQIVEFLVRGKRVLIGWSKKDYKMHIYKAATGSSAVTSYITQIQFFKKLVNGRDGDIALVVAALKRIKSKPAVIKVLERKANGQTQNVSVSASEENARNRRGAVDPVILHRLVSAYASLHNVSVSDACKQGSMIRGFFAGLDDSVNVDDRIDSYLTNL